MPFYMAFSRKWCIWPNLKAIWINPVLIMFIYCIRPCMVWNRPLKPSLIGLVLNCLMLDLLLLVQMGTCMSIIMILILSSYSSMWMILLLLVIIQALLPLLLLLWQFDLKDLGRLLYILGLQVDYTPTGLFVHQKKYTLDLLHKFSMSDCKPCKTPCTPNAHLLAWSHYL